MPKNCRAENRTESRGNARTVPLHPGGVLPTPRPCALPVNHHDPAGGSPADHGASAKVGPGSRATRGAAPVGKGRHARHGKTGFGSARSGSARSSWAGGGALAGCSAPAAVTAPASPAGDGAYAHLAELQRITDAAGGTRTTPSPGYDAAVDHVAAVLRAAGWDVSTPPYEVEGESGTGYRNVIAQTRTGDPGHVVMAGAHLDSVPEGPGINDNGSGVAALLQIAEQLGGSPDLPAHRPPRVLGLRGGRPRGLHRLRRRPRRGPARGRRAVRQPRHGRLPQRRLLRAGRHRP